MSKRREAKPRKPRKPRPFKHYRDNTEPYTADEAIQVITPKYARAFAAWLLKFADWSEHRERI